MEIIKGINLAASFLLELVMLTSISYVGFYGDKHIVVKLLIGVLLPAAIVAFWAFFMAPNARRRLSPTVVRIVALALFVIAAVGLYKADLSGWSVGLGVAAIINVTLAFIWNQ